MGPVDAAELRRALESVSPNLDRTAFNLGPIGTLSPIVASADRRLPLDRLQTVLQIQGIETVVVDTTRQSATPKPFSSTASLQTATPGRVAVSENALAQPVRESSLLAELRERVWLIAGIVGVAATIVVVLLFFGHDFTPQILTASDSSKPRQIEIEAHLDGVHLTAHEPAPSGEGGGDPAAIADRVGGGETHIHVDMGGKPPQGAAPAAGASGSPPAPVQGQSAAAGRPRPSANTVGADAAPAPADHPAGTSPPVRPASAEEKPDGPDTELSVKIDSSGKPNTITVEPSDQSSAPAPPPPPPLPPPEPPKADHRGLVPAFVLGVLLALTVWWVWRAWRPRRTAPRPGWVQRFGAVATMSLITSAGSWVVITRPPDAQVLTLAPAGPLKLTASLSGSPQEGTSVPTGSSQEAPDAGASSPQNGHHPGAFARFFARMHDRKPVEPGEQRPFHKLMKAMQTKQAAEKIRASAQTDWQQALPPPGSRRTLPSVASGAPMLEADVQAFWHAGAPADSHEHECVPSALARARSSLLERATWSYVVTETEKGNTADGGIAAAPEPPGLSLHADVDIPAEAMAGGTLSAPDTRAAPRAGPRVQQAQTIAIPLGQQTPPEVAALQGAPDKPDRPEKAARAEKRKRRLPPAPPAHPEPPTAAEKLLALLAGFVVGGVGGVFLRPRWERA
jgi:hypothetical protein